MIYRMPPGDALWKRSPGLAEGVDKFPQLDSQRRGRNRVRITDKDPAGFLINFSKTLKDPMDSEILRQRAAASLNVESSIIALSLEQAREVFKEAMDRLLNVSEWHTLPCSLFTALKLTDDKGLDVVDRQARENDYFIVNPEGGAREWVRVEKVYLQRDPSGSREVVMMRARPSTQPLSDGGELAHPSNTFKVTRDGLNVTVSVYGQNEKDELNRLSSNDTDDARPDSTVGAIHGVARVQWRSLVNGILSTWKE